MACDCCLLTRGIHKIAYIWIKREDNMELYAWLKSLSNNEGSVNEDFIWQPPTDAEMKLLEARRERSDKISKIMGDYLLRGYKMLGTVCDECDTILLEDKAGMKYCIACKELDTDTLKDDPVLNPAAAKTLVEERQGTAWSSSSSMNARLQIYRPSGVDIQPDGVSSNPTCEQSLPLSSSSENTRSNTRTINCRTSSSHLTEIPADTVETLCTKIKWASEELKLTTSVDRSIQLCQLLKACADAILSLKSLQ